MQWLGPIKNARFCLGYLKHDINIANQIAYLPNLHIHISLTIDFISQNGEIISETILLLFAISVNSYLQKIKDRKNATTTIPKNVLNWKIKNMSTSEITLTYCMYLLARDVSVVEMN